MKVISDVARRTDDSKLTDWYFGIDRWLLLYLAIMIVVGIVATLSTGSANAIRTHGHMPWYHFFVKMFPFYIIGLGTLFVTSMFSKKWVLKLSWLNVIICLPLLLMTFIHPQILNGRQSG